MQHVLNGLSGTCACSVVNAWINRLGMLTCLTNSFIFCACYSSSSFTTFTTSPCIMLVFNDINFVYCALATVSAAVGYGYSRRSFHRPNISSR